MDTDSKIYLNFSEELRTLFEEQDIRIQEVLQKVGIDAKVRFEALPPMHPGERTRDLVPVILARSVAAVSLATAVAITTSAISNFLDRQSHRPLYVEYQVEKPILDTKGNYILDKTGKIQTIRETIHKFIEPKNLNEQTFTVELGLTTGIVINMGTKPKS